jgi:hypothetical protein
MYYNIDIARRLAAPIHLPEDEGFIAAWLLESISQFVKRVAVQQNP